MVIMATTVLMTTMLLSHTSTTNPPAPLANCF
jgi:hypothetical protein